MKKILLLLCLSFSLVSAFAQDENNGEEQTLEAPKPKTDADKKSTIIVNIAPNVAGAYFRGNLRPSSAPRPYIGFDAGLTYEYLVSPKIAFGIGVQHSIKALHGAFSRDSAGTGGVILLNNGVIKRSYVEVPIYASFYFNEKPGKPYFQLGIVNQILYSMAVSSTDPRYTEKIAFSQLTKEGNSIYNLSLLAALGFRQQLPKNFMFGVEGVAKIGLLTPTNPALGTIYTVGLNLVGGYRF